MLRREAYAFIFFAPFVSLQPAVHLRFRAICTPISAVGALLEEWGCLRRSSLSWLLCVEGNSGVTRGSARVLVEKQLIKERRGAAVAPSTTMTITILGTHPASSAPLGIYFTKVFDPISNEK
ncbi:hypothetical protein B0H13DRAFT_1875014 [Mycena leptocephala]|nr:hypothetical protein B0H13DRAFT_1875014 [Mycena leptocephala]